MSQPRIRLGGSRSPVRAQVEDMLRLTNADGTPNVNALWRMAKDIEALKADVRSIVYDLAASLEEGLRRQGLPEDLQQVGLTSRPCRQADIEHPWALAAFAQLGEPPRYHRAAWEGAFILQALQEAGVGQGARGLDLGSSTNLGRALTGAGLTVTRAKAPPASGDFDACWSCAAAGHQGSIAAGSAFVVASLKALRVGGVAIHTFDFNVSSDDVTLDNWPAVLFRRSDIEALAKSLEMRGHEVAPLSFDIGDGPLDRFVDLPPFEPQGSAALQAQWSQMVQRAHLKVSIDGFTSTSYGLIVRRRI